MDMTQAVTVLDALRWGPMTPLELAEMEQFRFADPRPTYKDMAQILAMLERFELVKRQGIGDSTTSHWLIQPHAKQIRSVEQLAQMIGGRLGGDDSLGELERFILELLAELGGRSDLPTLRSRTPGGPTQQVDDFFQALAELQAAGLVAIGWGQTELDYPWLRLSRRGWLEALGHN